MKKKYLYADFMCQIDNLLQKILKMLKVPGFYA